MRRIVLRSAVAITALFILATSCQNRKKGTFTVTGAFKNADQLSAEAGPISKVYLLAVAYGKDQPPVVLDSAKLPVSNGNFTVSGDARNQGVFELVFGNNALAVPLINDAPEARVNVDLGKKDDFYDVSGSDASRQLKEFIKDFGKKDNAVEKIMRNADSLRQTHAPDSLQAAAMQQANNALQDLNIFLKQFINTCTNPTLCALALSFSSRSLPPAELQASLIDLLRKYPDNTALASLKQDFDQQQQQQAAQQKEEEEKSWVGKQAPDLTLPDANGKPVSIASFRGKYLLVDFWASWCGPCRAENPNVVTAYNEFKGKNFTILGVSLDKEKDPWQEAIHADHLEWTHVSDLKFWQSQAVSTFGFNGIPFNVLIDPQGKIIAQALRGDDLEKELHSVLK
jgi:peroxiredoxin